jgi:hypothetical protein
MSRTQKVPFSFRPAVEFLEDRVTPAKHPALPPFNPQLLTTLAQALKTEVTTMQTLQAQIPGLVAGANAAYGAKNYVAEGADYALMVADAQQVQTLWKGVRVRGDALISVMLQNGYFGNANQDLAKAAFNALMAILQTYSQADGVRAGVFAAPPVSTLPVAADTYLPAFTPS